MEEKKHFQPQQGSIKPKTNWIAITILALIVIGLGFLWLQEYKEDRSTNSSLGVNLPRPTGMGTKTQITKTSEIVPVDETWNKYTNYALGFSIKIPKQVGVSYCGNGYRPSKVRIVEDQTDNNFRVFYFFPAITYVYYSYDDEDVGNGECREEKEENINQLNIAVQKVENDKELENFIKKRYGAGCSLSKKKQTSQEGVFDLEIKGDGKSPEKSECFIGTGVTKVKYSSSKRLVVSIDLGQTCNLYVYKANCGKECIPECYDGAISDSFKFE